MSFKSAKIITVICIVFVVALVVGGIYQIGQNRSRSPEWTLVKSIDVNSEDNDIIKNPLTLEIPKINVKANIEHVGLIEDGKVDVPKGYQNVAWYKNGYYPAERGNAVISGHVDTPQGVRAIFADLDKVETGDFIVVWEDKHHVMFKVYDKKTFPVDKFPLDEVFGKTDERNLNLITCVGQMVNGKYPDRLVIFARKV